MRSLLSTIRAVTMTVMAGAGRLDHRRHRRSAATAASATCGVTSRTTGTSTENRSLRRDDAVVCRLPDGEHSGSAAGGAVGARLLPDLRAAYRSGRLAAHDYAAARVELVRADTEQGPRAVVALRRLRGLVIDVTELYVQVNRSIDRLTRQSPDDGRTEGRVSPGHSVVRI